MSTDSCYSLKKEDILKAHKEGCSDVKKTLETIAPELLKDKYPYVGRSLTNDSIVLFTAPNTGYYLGGGAWHFLCFALDWWEESFTPCKIKVDVL